MLNNQVPSALKKWFVLHFVADIIFAIPLFIIPVQFLTALGWQSIDPVTTRMVAAALFGIGGESLLARNASVDSYNTMLSLKIIWSAFAVIGLSWALFTGLFANYIIGISLLVIFVAFNILWTYWKFRLKYS